MFVLSPSLPPSLCVIIFPYPSPYLSLYPFLSLGSSDNVIPHWSDDVMPCPHVITLGSVCTFCALRECLSTIPLQTLLNSVQSVFIRWHCFATTLSEGPTAMCVVCLSCVCVFVFDTAYVSICVLPLHSCVGDLDEHVGVCTCMLVCVSVLSLPPSLLPSVCILSLPTPLPIFIAGDVQSDSIYICSLRR